MYVSIASPGPATRCTTCCFHCFTMVSMLHSCREKKNLRQQCRMRSERRNMSYFSHHFGRTLLFSTTTRGEENGGGCHRLDLLHSVRHAVSTASPWCQCCSLVAKRRTCVSSAERVSAVQNAKRATEDVVLISPLPDNASQFYLFIYMIEHRSVRSLMTFSVLLFVCRWLEGWSYVSHRYLEKNRARRSVNKFYRVLPTGKVGEDSNCRFQSTGPAGSACLTLVNGSFSGDFVMCDFTVGSI